MKKMKTPLEWWLGIKDNPELIINWLKNQYHGEATAASRIRNIITIHFEEDSLPHTLCERIANDEEKHATWIGSLLEARGIEPILLDKKERYWDAVLEEAPENGEFNAAIAAHAEEMRLERIKIIMNDETAPKDIVDTFKQIYKDEVFHAKAFKHISGQEYYDQSSINHAKGLEAIGLII